MDIELIVTKGLGDNSYLLAAGGEGAVIDPQRDIARYLRAAERLGVRIRYAVETHVHNDYVSGALDLRSATGAEVVAPARGGYGFPHRPVGEGDEVHVGDVRLVAMETPGHTPEHLAYLVHEGPGEETAAAVFTGGSLMVAGAGRTDLLGEAVTEELTRAQFRSLRRLATLPDSVEVLPTHGAGSFCGVGPAPKARTSTLGEERRRNGALAAEDEESFVRSQLSGLLAYPRYYRYMAPINRSGPLPLSDIPPPGALDPAGFAAGMDAGTSVVDGRPREAFAAAHIRGSVNVELDPSFASYVGWIVPFGTPVLLVLPAPEEGALAEAATQLFRIGYEAIEGYLRGGMEAWRATGRAVGSYRVARVDDLCRAYRDGTARVLDVRQQVEWDRGHIPGSTHVFVGDLPARLGDVPRGGEVWAVCASGHRSAMAASMVDAEGLPVTLVDEGGVEDFLRTCAPVGA